MKTAKVIILILITLSLIGCSWTEQDKCEFDNGRRAFLGQQPHECHK